MDDPHTLEVGMAACHVTRTDKLQAPIPTTIRKPSAISTGCHPLATAYSNSPQIELTDLCYESTNRRNVYIYRRHLLLGLLFSPKADIYFTVPLR